MKNLLYLFFLLPTFLPGQHIVSFGDSTLFNEPRQIPQSVKALIWTSPGRDFIYLHRVDSAEIIIGSATDCLIPNYPANAPGASGCDDGRYDRLEHFDCNTDVINASYMGVFDISQITFFPAPQGYNYHYLIFDLIGDGCTITFGIAFNANRFYGQFSIASNVIYNSQPFNLEIPPHGALDGPQGLPLDPDAHVIITSIDGRHMATGRRSECHQWLQPGKAYVEYERGGGFRKFVKQY